MQQLNPSPQQFPRYFLAVQSLQHSHSSLKLSLTDLNNLWIIRSFDAARINLLQTLSRACEAAQTQVKNLLTASDLLKFITDYCHSEPELCKTLLAHEATRHLIRSFKFLHTFVTKLKANDQPRLIEILLSDALCCNCCLVCSLIYYGAIYAFWQPQ